MRHYDNERIGKSLKKQFRFRRQRRAAQGYRFSDQEIAARRQEIKQGKFVRLDELHFTDYTEDL
jgi:hypothetical protein